MDYKVFYRKYRPDSFKNIIGQEYTKNMLQNAVKNEKVSHAYIFTGPRGTGKTSTAKVFAKSINCENPVDGEACGKCSSCIGFSTSADIIEIDAASNNGVDEVRELINNVKIAPTVSKYKIYIIDEVHMMTTSAFNALLLTLEEPPSHVVFIMATTNIESVPITILSRCQRFDFKKFTLEELTDQINYVCEQENITITPEAALEIAYISEGGMRDALSLLDQLSSNSKSILIDNILSSYGSISNVFIKNMLENVFKSNVKDIIEQFNTLKSSATDYKIFIKKLIQELMNYAIRLKTEYVKLSLTYEDIKDLIFELNDVMNRTNINVNPYVLIELVLLKYIDSSEVNVDNSELNDENKNIKLPLNEKNVDEKRESEEENPEKSNELETSSIDNVKQEQDILVKLKEIRVNNCFYGAKKDCLNELQNMWVDLSTSPIPDDILNLLLDVKLVAASSLYVILESSLASSALLINCNIDEITDYLCEFFDKELKFIALSSEEWKVLKNEYIKNIKEGILYEFIEEPVITEQIIKNNEEIENNIEKIAQDVFDHDKIEIE